MLKLQVILVGANQENGFKQGKEDLKLGGLVMFPMRWEFFFFLRITLDIVRGPTCDEDLRSCKGVVYESYREACSACGILEG